MLGILFSLLAFLFPAALGYAALLFLNAFGLMDADARSPRLLLLTPALGFVLLLLPTLWLNWAGVPVRYFALPLTLCLASFSAVAFVRFASWDALKQVSPFGALLACSLLLIGRPFFEYNLNWLSFSNEDMANYALGAQRLLDYGFLTTPPQQSFASMQNTSLDYWLLHAVHNARVGVEELLALFSALYQISPLRAFMPTIIAMHLMMVASAAALVFQSPLRRQSALLVATALTLSSLSDLGAIYQLFAQVCGLGLMCSSLALVPSLFRTGGKGTVLLLAILVAGTLATYPEVSPFLVGTAAVYAAIVVLRKDTPARCVLRGFAATAALVLILLNVELRSFAAHLLTQVYLGLGPSAQIANSLFWYYLVPTGPANLFGILPLSANLDDPRLPVYIVAGFILFVLYIAALVAQLRNGEIVAVTAGLMLAIGGLLFAHSSGFGLFKLAMYSQPFLLGVFALTLQDLGNHAMGHRPRNV